VIDIFSGYPALQFTVPDLSKMSPPYYQLLRIGRIYKVYARIQTRCGALRAGVDTLCMIQEVARQELAGSSLMIQKMIWISIVRLNSFQ
jgi:hypothetical protein